MTMWTFNKIMMIITNQCTAHPATYCAAELAMIVSAQTGKYLQCHHHEDGHVEDGGDDRHNHEHSDTVKFLATLHQSPPLPSPSNHSSYTNHSTPPPPSPSSTSSPSSFKLRALVVEGHQLQVSIASSLRETIIRMMMMIRRRLRSRRMVMVMIMMAIMFITSPWLDLPRFMFWLAGNSYYTIIWPGLKHHHFGRDEKLAQSFQQLSWCFILRAVDQFARGLLVLYWLLPVLPFDPNNGNQ